MVALLSQVLKYIFIVIIYLFIFTIIRMIYLDIRSMKSFDGGKEVAYLKVVNRLDSLNFKMQEYYVLKKKTLIGRSTKNDIVIKDSFVSKNHLNIREEDGIYYINDLDSANGTYLNGEPLYQEEELHNGDRIGVGFIQFLFVDK
ncbi:FHA domain-containing protein [Peptoniphilus sp. KCTC 25270]|uniref:FHA domain-containing protein n=1 Tax=Peptoniphilus sp. KCTC 25270 TaxID=2897414 RepID=UPI001E5E7DA7|nr:FHA domain-containing protein [Peptoniphilus sp. KCTC 25270]MCD1147027.1 FHA domain-containing protein [Peptoniphilus sp. KCTC 25270]